MESTAVWLSTGWFQCGWQSFTYSPGHVQPSHMWRPASLQWEMAVVQWSLLGSSINVNIDTLDEGDIETRSAVIDSNILSIYTQRSHHGIICRTFSHPVQQRSGNEPETTTCVYGKNLRGCDERMDHRIVWPLKTSMGFIDLVTDIAFHLL